VRHPLSFYSFALSSITTATKNTYDKPAPLCVDVTSSERPHSMRQFQSSAGRRFGRSLFHKVLSNAHTYAALLNAAGIVTQSINQSPSSHRIASSVFTHSRRHSTTVMGNSATLDKLPS